MQVFLVTPILSNMVYLTVTLPLSIAKFKLMPPENCQKQLSLENCIKIKVSQLGVVQLSLQPMYHMYSLHGWPLLEVSSEHGANCLA